jgi:hypothetical protein
MSRHFKKIDDQVQIAYGHDHATGYFFQLFDQNNGKEEEDYLVLDECSTFTSMNKAKMVKLMQENKISIQHIQQVVLDLPI